MAQGASGLGAFHIDDGRQLNREDRMSKDDRDPTAVDDVELLRDKNVVAAVVLSRAPELTS